MLLRKALEEVRRPGLKHDNGWYVKAEAAQRILEDFEGVVGERRIQEACIEEEESLGETEQQSQNTSADKPTEGIPTDLVTDMAKAFKQIRESLSRLEGRVRSLEQSRRAKHGNLE